MDKYKKFTNVIGKKYLNSSNQLKFDEPLKNHTTFKIGGPARIFFEARNSQELREVVSMAREFKIPYFILGGGSNILVKDVGFKGLVIKNKTQKIKILGYDGKITNEKIRIKNIFVKVDSGVLVNRLVRFTLDKGVGGFENFLGLPGTVGGAVYTNAHNFKAEDFFGDHLFEVYLLTFDGKTKKVSKKYFNFSYDKSKIQETKETVIAAVFSLKLEDKKKLWQKANKMMEYRLKTQPLGKLSAGCIFKNIEKSEAIRIPTPNYSTSAGFLIEAAGFKGERIGGAQISTLHANFILNVDEASALDVLKLIDLVQKGVKEKFGVELEEEIEVVGEFKYG